MSSCSWRAIANNKSCSSWVLLEAGFRMPLPVFFLASYSSIVIVTPSSSSLSNRRRPRCPSPRPRRPDDRSSIMPTKCEWFGLSPVFSLILLPYVPSVLTILGTAVAVVTGRTMGRVGSNCRNFGARLSRERSAFPYIRFASYASARASTLPPRILKLYGST